MTAERFDVFVVGSSDPSPAAQSRLATAVASRHGAPLASVAQAIAEKRLRAGSGLDRDAAEALARKLQGMGALVAVRTAVAKPAELPAPRPAPGAAPALRPFGGPREPQGGTPYVEPLPRFAAPPPAAPELDPFAPPPSMPMASLSMAAIEASAAPPLASPGLFMPTSGGDGSLELALDTPAPREHATPVVARSLPGASGLDTNRVVATSAASGLALGDEDPAAHTTRCPRHGLLYDKRRADGCRRCLEDVRAAAHATEGRRPSRQETALAALRESPARRAFLGLGFALFLGFLPAAYHAFRPGADEVRRLRAEQDELSHKTGTEDNLRRFDEIDLLVEHSRSRAARNTFIVWLTVSGVALAGWYRIT
jgi:hypothetical protein